MARYLWTQKEDIGPSARFGHAMTYDSVRSRTVLFGGTLFTGDQGGDINDTWEWNGEFWTQIADIGPANRRDHALCFDSVRQTALLFGGLSEQGNPLGDTWSWNGEDWTQLDDSGPSARKGYAMIFDFARGGAVLFGGVSAAGVVNDTWEWDGQAWTQQAETGPSPRWHHALGFDLVRNRVVFGCEADMTFCTAHVRFDPKRTLLFPKRTRFSNGR
ncbi:MAG: kelch repeat-containing protein [Pseudolabrys sp.]